MKLKRITLFIVITFQIFIAYGEHMKNLNPSYVHPLDFSNKAKAEWTLRDTLLNQLSSGEKDWDKISSKEQVLLEKYDEVYKDIWDIVGKGDGWYNAGGPKEVTASSYFAGMRGTICA